MIFFLYSNLKFICMKNNTTLFILLGLTMFQLPCEAQKTSSNSVISAQEVMAELDRKAEIKKKLIRSTPSDINVSGTIYYVAANGSDANNGLSVKKAFRSLDKVNSLDLQEGDAVLFRRGDLWRGSVKTKDGVTYSAYGKGAKPALYGSPCDASKEGKWTETETPNVYVYDLKLPDDIGTLVFNNGETCAFKVMKQRLE